MSLGSPVSLGCAACGDCCDPVRIDEAVIEKSPMCSNYPWYGSTPGDVLTKHPGHLPPRCSFALDVAPDLRRPDARPLIPLTVLRRAS